MGLARRASGTVKKQKKKRERKLWPREETDESVGREGKRTKRGESNEEEDLRLTIRGH